MTGSCTYNPNLGTMSAAELRALRKALALAALSPELSPEEFAAVDRNIVALDATLARVESDSRRAARHVADPGRHMRA